MGYSYEGLERFREILDRAVQSERGLRLRMKSEAAAHTLRSRLHSARAAERRRNADLPPDDPLFKSSPWEDLKITVSEDTVIIRKDSSFDILSVEEL